MVERKIIYSKKASQTLRNILSFYNRRNGSNLYSLKLAKELETLIFLLANNPFLGIQTDYSDTVRYLIRSNFKIFYEINPQSIDILMIWDTRRNPDDLELEFKND